MNPVITPQALVGMSDLARGVFVNPLAPDPEALRRFAEHGVYQRSRLRQL